jgi:hypothetical protein
MVAVPRVCPSSNLIRPGRLANYPGTAWALLMIGFYRDAIEAARADHRARRALVWECVAVQHQRAVQSSPNQFAQREQDNLIRPQKVLDFPDRAGGTLLVADSIAGLILRVDKPIPTASVAGLITTAR